MMECIACGIVKGTHEAVVIYEDELICCFMDIDPINNGHVLMVPKRHLKDVDNLTDDEMLRFMQVSKRILKCLKEIYDIDGYTMMQNGGAFDDLGHYHLHIFPRYKSDGFGWKCNPIDAKDIREEGSRIKELLEQ